MMGSISPLATCQTTTDARHVNRGTVLLLGEVGHRTSSGIMVEDRRNTPAGVAATRIDFKSWLRRLDRRKRAAAKLLASGSWLLLHEAVMVVMPMLSGSVDL